MRPAGGCRTKVLLVAIWPARWQDAAVAHRSERRPTGAAAVITAQQVREISFARTRGPGAYDAAAVDNMIRRVTATLDALEQGRTASPDGTRLLLPRDIRTGEPPAATDGAVGYQSEDVDEFRVQLVATLEEYVRRHAGPRRKASGAEQQTPAAAPASRPAAAATPAPITSTPSPAAVSAATVFAAATAATTATTPAPRLTTAQNLSSAPEGLTAYDVVLGLQTARAALFGDQRDHLLVRAPDGTLTRVVAVDTVADGIVVHAR
ncbi:hypothetical protein QUV83_10900 [Cellulomonas cellasea]|uniref:hypothetical protein n=1 Tax=Cellulomonas cellasea TaxID=43670 RepID=UPI0025A4B86C|nr:hypothetical protein [Cellulomonas cellasea]MDM8085273.1 hypothetical protein [Cellulomonas cellasea]